MFHNEGAFYKDELSDMKTDPILANPPFNISDREGTESRKMFAGHMESSIQKMQSTAISSNIELTEIH